MKFFDNPSHLPHLIVLGGNDVTVQKFEDAVKLTHKDGSYAWALVKDITEAILIQMAIPLN